jgi:hypothetical protein
MKPKIKRMIVWGLVLLLPGLYFSCEKDLFDSGGDSDPQDFLEAKSWYDAASNGLPMLKSASKDLKVYIAPNWKEGLVKKPKKLDATTVETAIEASALVTFIDDECLDLWKQTKDEKFKQSLTRFVYVRDNKTKKGQGFFMTIMPGLDYLAEKNFVPFYDNSYMDIDENYSGHILYHNIDGSFANGWKYEHGQITHIINQQETGEVFTRLKSGHMECQTYQYTVVVQVCTDYYTITEFGVNYSGTSCYYYTEVRDTWQECYWVDDGTPDYPPGGYIPPTTTPEPTPVNPLTTATTPCDVIAAYKADATLKAKLAYLEKFGKGYEEGYMLTVDNSYSNSSIYTYKYSHGTEKEMDFTVPEGQKADGFIHSHGPSVYQLYSFSDVYAVYYHYKNGNINNLTKFSMILVNSSGTAFNLIVTDTDRFVSFIENKLSQKSVDGNNLDLAWGYFHVMGLEIGFGKFFEGAGLRLYKATSGNGYSTWSEFYIDGRGVPKYIDCN